MHGIDVPLKFSLSKEEQVLDAAKLSSRSTQFTVASIVATSLINIWRKFQAEEFLTAANVQRNRDEISSYVSFVIGLENKRNRGDTIYLSDILTALNLITPVHHDMCYLRARAGNAGLTDSLTEWLDNAFEDSGEASAYLWRLSDAIRRWWDTNYPGTSDSSIPLIGDQTRDFVYACQVVEEGLGENYRWTQRSYLHGDSQECPNWYNWYKKL